VSYSLIRESFPVAAKQHRCIWCGEAIPVGLKHRHEVSSYDGAMQDHRWHMECDDDAKKCFAEGDQDFLAYSAERPVVTMGGRDA
jgi:hypothetical protein